jgi:hypothetical protein
MRLLHPGAVIYLATCLGGDVPLTHRFGRYCPMKVVIDGFAVGVSDGSLDMRDRPDLDAMKRPIWTR